MAIKEQGEYRKRTVVKERRNRLSKEWNKTNISSVLCTHAKRRAKDCAVPFSLKKEDILVPECCPVLGFKLDINNKRLLDNSPPLDRVIPGLGYIKGNVQVISFRANRIKNNATLEELEKVTDYVRKNTF